jgi:hypothetical protein
LYRRPGRILERTSPGWTFGLFGGARVFPAVLKASRPRPITQLSEPEGTTAMNFSPEQVQEHISKLTDASVEETDDLLHDLCCLAWPTTDSQNN